MNEEKKLSEQYEKYCLEYIRLGSQYKAYQSVYGTENIESCYASSTRLHAKPEIQSRIYELQQQMKSDLIMSSEEILSTLTSLARDDTVSVKDRTRCLELLGKRNLLWAEKHNVEISGNPDKPLVIQFGENEMSNKDLGWE